jgi:hypothetical protein
MKVRIMGKCWNLRFTPLWSVRGQCFSPTTKWKEIQVDSRLRGEERLEILLHETLHAACWWLDEEHVSELARDQAKILFKLGYRMQDDDR